MPGRWSNQWAGKPSPPEHPMSHHARLTAVVVGLWPSAASAHDFQALGVGLSALLALHACGLFARRRSWSALMKFAYVLAYPLYAGALTAATWALRIEGASFWLLLLLLLPAGVLVATWERSGS